jgi:hypothetical protein
VVEARGVGHRFNLVTKKATVSPGRVGTRFPKGPLCSAAERRCRRTGLTSIGVAFIRPYASLGIVAAETLYYALDPIAARLPRNGSEDR